MDKKTKTKLEETKRLRKPDGTVVYYLDNKLHNPDGPAIIHPNGKKNTMFMVFPTLLKNLKQC